MRDREPDSTGADCPAETLLLAFASGGASSDDHRVVEAHLSTCDICRLHVSALAPTLVPRNEPSSGPASAVAVGEILAGKYEILRVIGEVGMGQVLEARHLTLECSVALKLLHRSVAEDREAVMRFLREARAAAALDSDHVVRVLDAGTLPGTEEPYVVLEYLNGSDLSKLIRDRGPLPIEEALGYVLQACEALSLAHARGIVHRDIKPANLFLTQRPDGSVLVKVLDFGIAKIAEVTPEHQAHAERSRWVAALGLIGKQLCRAGPNSPGCVRRRRIAFGRRSTKRGLHTGPLRARVAAQSVFIRGAVLLPADRTRNGHGQRRRASTTPPPAARPPRAFQLSTCPAPGCQ